MTDRHVVVEIGDRVVADTRRAVRVCETSHPPVYYVPREDIAAGVLERGDGRSWCEWKGPATYWDAVVDGELARPQPGDFYGGWITDEVVGPFKGEAGTLGW